MGRRARPPGGQLRDQPPEHHRQGLRRLRAVLGPRRGGLRPVAALAGRAEDEVREVRPAEGEGADEGGRGSSGFDVTMTTFSTPTDYAAIAALIKNDLRRSGSTSTSSPRTRPPSPPRTARASSTGISPPAACAATSTATSPSTTRSSARLPGLVPGLQAEQADVPADRQRPHPARHRRSGCRCTRR